MILEIRTYRLRGDVDSFVELMRREALPLLAAEGIDVVACGASLAPRDGDPSDAYLIRAFENEVGRERDELAFYGSDAWRSGPREAVLARIAPKAEIRAPHARCYGPRSNARRSAVERRPVHLGVPDVSDGRGWLGQRKRTARVT